MEAGHWRRASARRFGVGESCAIKLLRRKAEHGSIEPEAQGQRPGTGKLTSFETFLITGVEEAKPDITMPELTDRLATVHGVEAAPSSLSRILCRHGLTYKKVLMTSECERADVVDARPNWTTSRQPWMRSEPGRLVFINGEKGK